MSSSRRDNAPKVQARRSHASRTPRLRLAVTGAVAIAMLGGGTAFACMDVPTRSSTGHPARGGAPTSVSPSSTPTGSAPATVAPVPAVHTSTHPTRKPRPVPPPASAVASKPPTTTPAPSTPGSQDAVQQVLALINQNRAAQGLPAYTLLDGLNRSAAGHNQVMAAGCGLSHQCPGEPAFSDRESAQGVHWTSAGENIGEGGGVADNAQAIATSAVGLTQMMLDEKPPHDGHRRNMLSSSYTHVGIAIYRDSSGTVWLTQDFAN
jgi:uncharacterized protein YkwD